MKFDQIEKLIKLLDETSINEFRYETEEVNVRICKNAVQYVSAEPVVHKQVSVPMETQVDTEPVGAPATSAAQQVNEVSPAQVDESLHEIVSPMVGTFYASPSPDAPAFVEVGTKVQKNTVVCMIEAMKLFNQLEAEVNGEIVEVCVENGQFVEYGQPLFRVK